MQHSLIRRSVFLWIFRDKSYESKNFSIYDTHEIQIFPNLRRKNPTLQKLIKHRDMTNTFIKTI